MSAGRKVVRREEINYAGVSCVTMSQEGGWFNVSKQTGHGLITVAAISDILKAEEIFHRTVQECRNPNFKKLVRKVNVKHRGEDYRVEISRFGDIYTTTVFHEDSVVFKSDFKDEFEAEDGAMLFLDGYRSN